MPELSPPHNLPPNPHTVLSYGQELLRYFGVELNPFEEPKGFLEAIKQLDPRFQGGRELVRWQLEQDQTQWPEEAKKKIIDAAEKMRMIAHDEDGNPISIETALIGHFNLVIVLGGARQAPLDRARYAVASAEDSGATFSHLVVAGSSRKLNEQEQEATRNYSPDAKIEFDLAHSAAKILAMENPGLTVGSLYVKDEKAGTPAVMHTALQDFRRNEVVQYGDTSVAAVTTQIYQTSTTMDLERVARRYGITTKHVAGNPSDLNIIRARTPATYLTEILRTLKAATLAAQKEI